MGRGIEPDTLYGRPCILALMYNYYCKQCLYEYIIYIYTYIQNGLFHGSRAFVQGTFVQRTLVENVCANYFSPKVAVKKDIYQTIVAKIEGG